jgi:antitoxin ParD1/3/4
MPTSNVNLSDELESYIQAKVESGHYENASEVVRAALLSLERYEREDADKLTMLRTAIDVGDASGLADGNPFTRIRAAIQLRGKTS